VKFTPLPDINTLNALLDYNSETGLLYWKSRDASWFAEGYMDSQGRANNWNARFAGKEALGYIHAYGYKNGNLMGKVVKAHRVAWKMYHEEEPLFQIDHINGIRHDNRIENLRLAPGSDNRTNACMYKNNNSGRTGVHWLKDANKWRAAIRLGGKVKHLGVFTELEDAIKARAEAEKEMGFHANHGRSPVIRYD